MGITNRGIKALAADGKKTTILWDDEISGFGVRALPSGRKTFCLKYRTSGGGRRSRQRWLKIGVVGSMSLSQARILALERLSEVAKGIDPQGRLNMERATLSLNEVWSKFETEILPLRKPKTVEDYNYLWKNDIRPALGVFKATEISRKDIQALHTKFSSTPYKANRVLALVSRLLSQCEIWEIRQIGSNPCRVVKAYPEKARNRYLSVDEVNNLASTLTKLENAGKLNRSIGNGIRLLILTGARKSEIFGAKVTWINEQSREIMLPDSKTGVRSIYLNEPALKLCIEQVALAKSLRSDYLFPSPKKGQPLLHIKKAWKIVCDHADMKDVRVHDLRHTYASLAVGIGISLPIVGRLLGHTQPKTTQRYAHVDTDPALNAVDAISLLVGRSLLN